jgi:hypothetical protein
MSRTIRRTRDKRRNKSGCSNFDTSWTFDWVHPEHLELHGCWVRVKLEGKAYEKAWWRFHSDWNTTWGNGKGSRVDAEGQCRMKNKLELARYSKDDEYEIQLYEPRCLSWDR